MNVVAVDGKNAVADGPSCSVGKRNPPREANYRRHGQDGY